MTSQPKRAAMELLRCKIEEASERVRLARDARTVAAASLARADELSAAAESDKASLVRDLNALILQSSVQQFQHLEELQARMDSLSVRVGGDNNVRRPSAALTFAVPSTPSAGNSPESSERNTAFKDARKEMEAAAAVERSAQEQARLAQAAAHAAAQAQARAAHVQLPGRSAPLSRFAAHASPRASPPREAGFVGFSE